MVERRVEQYFGHFRAFSTYFTALFAASVVTKVLISSTVLSYVSFTIPFVLVLSLWTTYVTGLASVAPNSTPVRAVRLVAPLLLVLTVLLEYGGLIGTTVDRDLLSFVFLALIGCSTIAFVSCKKPDEQRGQSYRRSLLEVLRRSVIELSSTDRRYLAGVLLLAAGLRVHELSTYSFIADETIHLAISDGIHASLLPKLPSGLFYVRSFVYSYSVAISTRIFGLTEFGLRFPSVVFGVVLVFVGYLGGTLLFDRKTGLIVALLLAIDPFLIGFSRIGRFYVLFYLLATASVTFFYTSFVTNRTGRWLFEAVAILAVLSHDLSILLFPPFVFWWLKNNVRGAWDAQRVSDLLFVITPVVVWVLFRRLRTYTIRETMPGTPILEISRPLLGPNWTNIHFYWEVLVNPYAVFVLLAVLAIVWFLGRSSNHGYSYEVSYVSSFILTYVFVLGYVAQRNNLRFVVVCIPLLLVLFGWLLGYVSEGVLTLVRKYPIRTPPILHRRSLFSFVIVVVVVSNLALGSVIIEPSHANPASSIPENTEPNWKLLEQHLRGNEYAFQSKTTHYLFVNTKDATEYVARHATADSILISTSNYGPVDAYLPVDYSTNYHISRYLGYKSCDVRYDRYRALPILSNASAVESIFDTNRSIWIVADVRFEGQTRSEVRQYIENNSRLAYVSPIRNSSEHTSVFGDRSRVRVYHSPGTNGGTNRTAQLELPSDCTGL